MEEKFQRNYKLTIDTSDGGEKIIVEMPLTINFTIHRAVGASVNTAQIEIINLGAELRNRIYQDWNVVEKNRKVQLEVGYGGKLTTIFKGSIFQAWSMRVVGSADITTTIVSMDGQYDASKTMIFQTLESQEGTSISDIFNTLIGGFENLKAGVIGIKDAIFNRPVVLDGNNWDQINKFSNGQCFIDLEKVYVLAKDQAYEGADIQVIDASTGLLETPRREQANLTIKTLLEPRSNLGQIIRLSSPIMPQYDGVYKVNGTTHQGTISETKGGRCSTTTVLYAPQLGKGLEIV